MNNLYINTETSTFATGSQPMKGWELISDSPADDKKIVGFLIHMKERFGEPFDMGIDDIKSEWNAYIKG